MTSGSSWAIAIFAHNEEKHIARCLDSVRNTENCQIDIYVLANGCTDSTELVVRDYAVQHKNVRLVVISIGDKCNAWNHFIHSVSIKADYY